MPNRVRDLEQLQELDSDERQRKRGTLAMAALAILLLAFAIGIVVGKAVEPASPERDPLDQLDRVAEANQRETSVQPMAAKQGIERPAVEAVDLTFERRLTEVEERPEVLAALAAAEREEERMALHTGAAVQAAAPGDRAAVELGGLEAEDDLVETDVPAKPGIVPASMAAAASNQKLVRAKRHDKLIAAALPRTAGAFAAHGSDGEFTLQVISYPQRSAADAFASALRARGHEAFVTSAEIDGRGRSFRVRLGPFKTRESAEAYRRDFEARERMNTIVVKRSESASND